MVLIKTTVEFEAAHRQLGDKGKCGYLHGHNWMVDVSITGNVTSDVGYLIDFKTIKDLIVSAYDHKTLLQSADPLVDVLQNAGQRVCKLPLNPTCENLATMIKDDIVAVLNSTQIDIVTVTVWENNKSMAIDQWVSLDVAS